MRSVPAAALLLSAASLASGIESYTVPGLETDRVRMSIHVWGEVGVPGTHLVPVGADLVAGISAAGGPTPEADLGGVSIVYEGSGVEYDLGDFLRAEGEPVPTLRPGATIHVPTRRYEWWKDAIDFAYKIIIAVNVVWLMLER